MDSFEPGEEGGEANIVLIGGKANFVVEVGAGSACYECFHSGGAKAEGGNDVVADARGGGRGEADYWDGREGRSEMREVRVGGPEVVAPFGDAVGFVNGDAG